MLKVKSAALSLCLLFALAVPASAQEGGPTLFCIYVPETVPDIVSYLADGGQAVALPLESCQSDTEQVAPVATPEATIDFIHYAEWTAHKKAFGKQGRRLGNSLSTSSIPAMRRGASRIVTWLDKEGRWVVANRDRFEPGSCYADEVRAWEKHRRNAENAAGVILAGISDLNAPQVKRGAAQFTRSLGKMDKVFRHGEICE